MIIRLIITIFLIPIVVYCQDIQIYPGSLDFDYSGEFNGDFLVGDMDLDSLAIPDSGTFLTVIPNGEQYQIIIPAIRESENMEGGIDMFLMMMSDEDGNIEPQTWGVEPIDPTNLVDFSATMLYIPDMDSSLVLDIIAPLLEGEIDSTNFQDYLLEPLLVILQNSFFPVSGSISITEANESEVSGNFEAVLMRLNFPPDFLYVEDGDFEYIVISDLVQLPPPFGLIATIENTSVSLTWNYDADPLINYFGVYHSTFDEDSLSLIFETDGLINTFFHDNPGYGVHIYSVVSINLLGIESDHSNSETVFISDEVIPGNGDVNFDGVVDVLDIVQAVNHVLGDGIFENDQFTEADVNGDHEVDILDIVVMVNHILDS